MKRKNRFNCGHAGHGQFCHRCQQREMILARDSEKRSKRMATLDAAPIPLTHLPKHVAIKTLRLLATLSDGTKYSNVYGKRLKAIGQREIVSIPVNYAFRLICEYYAGTLLPIEVLSHEKYNGRLKTNGWH